MRLVCLHADTVDALKRLGIQFDDLTPNGLWSSQYHLLGLTADQMEALELFRVEFEDVTPAQLAQLAGQERKAGARGGTAEERRPQAHGSGPAQGQGAAATSSGGQRSAPVVEAAGAASAGPTGWDAPRAASGNESEVPLAQSRDAGARAGETKSDARADAKPDSKTGPATTPAATPQGTGAQTSGGQPGSGQKGAGKGGAPGAAASAQGGRKGQSQGLGQTAPSAGGQRYGTTRLRISVAGKYTEATVANGKIVVAGRAFDSPDQAAAELTKSRGDWTFWEYYDSADGKWRMLTRDWDTVLKSASPGGR